MCTQNASVSQVRVFVFISGQAGEPRGSCGDAMHQAWGKRSLTDAFSIHAQMPYIGVLLISSLLILAPPQLGHQHQPSGHSAIGGLQRGCQRRYSCCGPQNRNAGSRPPRVARAEETGLCRHEDQGATGTYLRTQYPYASVWAPPPLNPWTCSKIDVKLGARPPRSVKSSPGARSTPDPGRVPRY